MDQRYAPQTDIPGTVYRVIREIGEGGMGRVYEVEDTSIGKRYALKTLLSAHASSPELAERMRLESRTMVQIAHPNIVDVITAGVTADGCLYYVMELLKGDTLRKVIRKSKALDPVFAVAIAIDVGEAVESAHGQGVVHRDLKPDNIFIALRPDMTTHAKVVDFGLVAVLDKLRDDELGEALGTPRYASPEQLRGAKASHLMDIWSFGAVLFEMIAGRPPYLQKSLPELIRAIQSPEPPPRLSEVVPGVDPRLAKLTQWCLEKDPSRRLSKMSIATSELRTVQRVLEASIAANTLGVEDFRTQETLLGMIHRTSPGEKPSEEKPKLEGDHPPPANPDPQARTLVGIAPARLLTAAPRQFDHGAATPAARSTSAPTPTFSGDPFEAGNGAARRAADRTAPLAKVEPGTVAATSTHGGEPPPDSSKRFIDLTPTPASNRAAVPLKPPLAGSARKDTLRLSPPAPAATPVADVGRERVRDVSQLGSARTVVHDGRVAPSPWTWQYLVALVLLSVVLCVLVVIYVRVAERERQTAGTPHRDTSAAAVSPAEGTREAATASGPTASTTTATSSASGLVPHGAASLAAPPVAAHGVDPSPPASSNPREHGNSPGER